MSHSKRSQPLGVEATEDRSSNNSVLEDKLIPLRKFVIPGVYSAAYLSQLVQRKKLKAKRIGRNFYTSEKWFKEYIEKHARDEKQIEFVKNFSRSNVYLEEQKVEVVQVDWTPPAGGDQELIDLLDKLI